MSFAWKKIEKDKKEQKVQIHIKIIVHMFLVIIAFSLREKFNFGYHRIWRLIRHIDETFNDVYFNRINIKDLEKVLKDECEVIIP